MSCATAKAYVFRPSYSVVGHVPGIASIASLAAETGVYSATPEFVRANCGPIANQIMDLVPESYAKTARDLGLYLNVDVRIHRLYPGDFPAYPGWHCDGEYRETYFAQPDLERIHVHNHLVATVSSVDGGVSNTRFLKTPFSFQADSAPTSDNTLWGQVHRALEATSPTQFYDSRDGELIQMDSWTLHKCMPAKVRGWRLFFRMSMWHRPNLGNGGMISRQEQVYKLHEGGGW